MSSIASPLLLEVLEGRIVPAVLVDGANVIGGTVDGIAQPRIGTIGAENSLAVEVFEGQIIVWFDATVDSVVGVSVGADARFDFHEFIFGDVVTNLAGNGRLSDSDGNPDNGYDGRVLLPWDISESNFFATTGRIIAGGSIRDVHVTHTSAAGYSDEFERPLSEGGLYTGNGIFKADTDERVNERRPGPEGTAENTYTVSLGELDINPLAPGDQNTIVLEAGLAQYGRRFDIHDISFSRSNGAELWAGDGIANESGRGGAGGNIFNITGSYSTPPTPGGFVAVAGDGGDGTIGGTGGSISDISMPGNHPFFVFLSGDGGQGVSAGGNAGRISGITLDGTLENRFVEIAGGDGGSGFKRGGRGGEIVSLSLTGGYDGIDILAGSGGDSGRRGGDGGRIFDIAIQSTRGLTLSVFAGNGGTASEGTGGRGAVLSDVSLNGNIPFAEIGAGDGGEGARRGGTGGNFYGVTTEIALPQTPESNAEWLLRAGAGGGSVSGSGGAGGSIWATHHLINPSNSFEAYWPDEIDSTFRTAVVAGDGGDGAVHGGAGGHVRDFTARVIHDQLIPPSRYIVVDNPAVISIQAGNGGNGVTGAGGSGGAVILTSRDEAPLRGFTWFDPDRPFASEADNPEAAAIQVYAGDGGSGPRRGGTGGSILGVTTANGLVPATDTAILPRDQLGSALLMAGSGGDTITGRGGLGGHVTNTDIAVSSSFSVRSLEIFDLFPETPHAGHVTVLGGTGGDAPGDSTGNRGTGGNGGHVKNAFLSVTSPDEQLLLRGALVAGGAGGDGASRGGLGGNLNRLELHTPSIETVYTGVLVAGHGGDATGARGSGGNGGSIYGVVHRDVNSYINVIHAGNGGDGPMRGGRGGNVSSVTSTGLIGVPSVELVRQGAFATEIPPFGLDAYFPGDLLPQGVFAGRGGDADISGANGNVTNIQARHIAAIGAGPNAEGQFAPATAVSNIRAQTIGFELEPDNFFQPGEGFILADRVGRIDTANSLRTDRFTNPTEAFVVTA